MDQEYAPNVLLTITCDLGSEQDKIVMFENDDPQMVARLFGEKHNLTEEEVGYVLQNIHDNMQHVLTEGQEEEREAEGPGKK